MHFTRRAFLGTVSAAAAVTGAPRSVAAQAQEDDPLGTRSDFPIVAESIYLNSPYITPSPLPAVDATRRFLEAKALRPTSLGEMLNETNAARRKFAQLVGASEAEIGMLFATSDGENIVSRALALGPGDNVVIDDLHYETTFLLYRHLAEEQGVELRIVPSEDGVASPETFAPYVDDGTRLVSVSWVSHQNGYHHDLKAFAELAHGYGAYLYADAIQGIGMLSLDVKETGVDFFAAGTYKWLLGGYGVAPFYVREELLDTITPDRMGSLHISNEMPDHRFELYSDARKYGYATLGFGAMFQLSAALDYLLEVGVDRIERHTVALAHRIHAGLTDQGYEVWTPPNNRSAIVAFNHGLDVARVRSALDDANISVTIRNEGRTMRVGAALFNNGTEIDRFLNVMGDLAG